MGLTVLVAESASTCVLHRKRVRTQKAEALRNIYEREGLIFVETTAETSGWTTFDIYTRDSVSAQKLCAQFGGRVLSWTQRDWTRKQREAEKPMRIGSRFVVIQTEAQAKLKACRGRTPLIIPHAMAFGTGSHATTWMCLRAISELPAGARFLDVGTGSGILAIAASILGWQQVTAIDNDPASIKTVCTNATANGVALKARLGTLANLKSYQPADLVVANILLNPLMQHAHQLFSVLAPGGCLILSGVKTTNQHELIESYKNLKLIDLHKKDGWICAVLQR